MVLAWEQIGQTIIITIIGLDHLIQLAGLLVHLALTSWICT
jgi:hypothetical protein